MQVITNYFQRIKTITTWLIRKKTAKQRVLPNCLIIGAQKAGTSSLYHHLVQHPQVKASFCKEVHFFDGGINEKIDTFAKGESWYRANFPLASDMQTGDVCIDATPMYLFNPLSPARIKTLLPKAKLIILLRNPVERAISHYYHVKRHGLELLTLEEALSQEKKRLASTKKNKDYKTPAFRLYSYQERGLYLEQIKRYQTLFNDEQLLILNCDELFKNPESTLKKVFAFLNIDSKVKINNLKSQNVGKNKENISEESYQRLQEYYTQANKDLFQHIKEDFKW